MLLNVLCTFIMQEITYIRVKMVKKNGTDLEISSAFVDKQH